MKAPQIDLFHLERYVAGDKALRDEVLRLFEVQAESWVKKFDMHLGVEEWCDMVHTMKGAARNIGAFGLGHICEKAERLTDEEDAHDKDTKATHKECMLAALRTELDATVEAVKQIRTLQSLQ